MIEVSFQTLSKRVWDHVIDEIESYDESPNLVFTRLVFNFLQNIDPDISEFLKLTGINVNNSTQVYDLIMSDIRRNPSENDLYNTEKVTQVNLLLHAFIFEASKSVFLSPDYHDEFIKWDQILSVIGISGPLEKRQNNSFYRDRLEKYTESLQADSIAKFGHPIIGIDPKSEEFRKGLYAWYQSDNNPN